MFGIRKHQLVDFEGRTSNDRDEGFQSSQLLAIKQFVLPLLPKKFKELKNEEKVQTQTRPLVLATHTTPAPRNLAPLCIQKTGDVEKVHKKYPGGGVQ